MYFNKIFVAFTIAIALPAFSKGHDFVQEVEKLHDLPLEEFLNQYPFTDYIEVCAFNNIKELEYQKRYLDRLGIDGRAFIYRLYQEYVASAKMDFNNTGCMKKLLFSGQLMAYSRHYLHPDSATVYMAASDLIFTAISDSLETLLEKGELDKRSFSVRYVIDRLSENKYHIDVPVSNWEKLRMHLKERNFAYVWRKATGTYLKEFLVSLSIAILIVPLVLWFTYRWWRKQKKGKAKIISKRNRMAASLIILALSLGSWSNNSAQYLKPSNAGIVKRHCSTSKNGLVKVYELFKEGSFYGHSIRMDLSTGRIHAHYIPGQEHFSMVNQLFLEWSANKNILLNTSGAYTVRYKGPLGFCVDQGEIANKHWKKDMDALVIVQRGVLSVYNKNERISTPDGQSFSLLNGIDKARLENWAAKNELTIFQTHLLAHQSELMIGREGRNKVATRKFLALTQQDNKTYASVYYTDGDYLYDAALSIYEFLSDQPNCRIHALINLDTGVQDVLEVAPALRNCNEKEVKGLVSNEYAMNLLTFYQN